jgi:hypothetical protein
MTIGPRVVLDNPKFAAWLKATFNMHTAADAFARITEIDALAETVTVDGQEHQIPPDCYVDLFAEPEPEQQPIHYRNDIDP